MNLRNAENYSIGLDLGTASVGWAVVGPDGRTLHVKGKPAWGARLYPNADQAADRRIKRSQRRRYERRKQRLYALAEFFYDEVGKIDPDFFTRLRWSFLLTSDARSMRSPDFPSPIFNGTDFTERQYYEQFPTIWHLRRYLIETGKQADIRLVYLALHNIVKYRGNFLRENQPSLSASNAKMDDACRQLADAIAERAESLDIEGVTIDTSELAKTFSSGHRRGAVVDEINDGIIVIPGQSRMVKAIAQACVGNIVEFSDALGVDKVEGDGASKFSLSNDEKVDEFECPDEATDLFMAIQRVYSSYILQGLLLYSPGNTISYQFCEQYSIHGKDLKILKALVKRYCPDQYFDFFRGPKFSNVDYDFNKIATPSYTAYILGESLCNKKGCSHDDLIKAIKGMLDPEKITALGNDPDYLNIKDRLTSDNSDFLMKQKTRNNGAIPYQLHLEEMDKILKNQGKYYPFLKEHTDDIEKLVSSRIPYYVGPLNAQYDPGEPFKANTADQHRKFAWSQRKTGMENAKAYPWNIDEVIDKDQTAEKFIRRMTGTCTYLYDEPVLPKHSLLYEEFCVLNELNGARWRSEGGRWDRFDRSDRERIYNEVFKKRKTVSYRAVEDWMRRNHEFSHVEVVGGQKENGFASSLASHYCFCGLLGVEDLEGDTSQMVEELILWCTLFEDRDILRYKVESSYGDKLTSAQIDKVCKQRYTGWGRLSEKLLCELVVDTPNWGPVSIMEVLRLGNPANHGRTVIFQEIINDNDLGFQKLIDDVNASKVSSMSIDDMPGSPALRRTVNQALRIVDELVEIARHQPAAICIEETRDDDEQKRGVRTSTREKSLRAAYEQFMSEISAEKERAEKENNRQLLNDLAEYSSNLSDERVMLYFSQRGKSLYSHKSLDIRRLNEYEVDHIIPRSYIKDDSLENKALVLKSENQNKLDSLLIGEDIRRDMSSTWEALHAAKLIGDKKFRNLMRNEINDKAFQGFISRQLVETSQVVKFVRQMLEQRYPDTDIKTVRASVSSGIRDNADFPKCREANDYHHAQDAYLACQVSRFMDICYPAWQDPIQLQYIRRQFTKMAKEGIAKGRLPERSGFIADMFMLTHPDKETGEIIWDANEELAAMRRELYFKQCYITRMLEIRTGAFWDETVYSPRDTKNGKALSAPLKNNAVTGLLPTELYGGYNNVKQAYFFAFTAIDKKGRLKYFFEGLPISLSDQVRKDAAALDLYAEAIAESSDCHDVSMLRRCIPYQQTFILDGTRYILAGKTGGRNVVLPANESAYDIEMMSKLNVILANEAVDENIMLDVLDSLIETLSKSCEPKKKILNLDKYRDTFISLSYDDKRAVLEQILLQTTGAKPKASADLSKLGGSKQAGQISKDISSCLENVTWIDTSVTGIFETQTNMKDICNGI